MNEMTDMNTNFGRCLLIDENLMDFEPLHEIVADEGAEGLAAVMALLLRLIQYPGCITTLSDVNYVGAQIRKRGSYMRRIINDYGLFRVTEDGKRFFSPYLRLKRKAGPRRAEEWLLDTSMTDEEVAEREAAANNQITNNKQ